MLNLLCSYTPKVYHSKIGTDTPGQFEDGETIPVIVFAVIPTSPGNNPDLLGATHKGKFVCDTIDRFTYLETDET